MKYEYFNKVIGLNNRLEELRKARKTMDCRPNNRLGFVRFGHEGYDVLLTGGTFTCVDDILKRHEEQIKQEVNEEINRILKQIEAL